ncbi:MAG: hypothetical protein RLZ98_2581 [Pseudomonadota bacterium]|jgi:carbon-monoxide dehydrogenase large subunit
MGEFALGQPVPRFEDPRLLRGGGRYADDIAMPGMAYGYVLRSEFAHARIIRLDTTVARAAPGVLAVLTGEDWANSGYADLPVPTNPSLKRRDGSALFRPPYPAIAKDVVKWVGDHVAFVVAETYEQAVDAAELIEVEYEPLPAVITTEEAVAEGAPKVWDNCPGNVCYNYELGDKAATEKAFAEAAHVIERRLRINRVTAATMEPRACLGYYDKAEDRYTIHTTLQRAFNFRQEIAAVLKVPESKVHVIAGDIGGSYGMKSAVYPENLHCILASKIVGRPVKWRATRSEAFLSDAQARDNVADIALALDKDLKFTGLRVRNVVNVGSYLQTGGETSAISNLVTLQGLYTTPAIYLDITTVFSNTNSLRPYRGNGRPENAYLLERLVDIAADVLKVDPAELRRRNLIPKSALPYKSVLKAVFDSGDFEGSMDIALKNADYAGFESRRAEAAKRGKLRGIGISNSIEKAAAPGIEAGEIRFDRGGSVTILCGAIDQGQGHETVFKQLVCDKLGLDPADVHYVQGDTDAVFYGEGTGGSRTATLAGSALLHASERVIDKAKKIAAHMLEVDEVEFKEGVFTSRSTNETVTIKDAAKAASQPAKLPKGMEPGLIATAVYDNRETNYPNGCHVCELQIDPDTGHVEMIKYTVVDDVGTVLNPLLLKGQIRGGVAQGVGQILKEDILFSEDGQLLTGSFMDYAMPHAADFSNIDVTSNPSPTPTNPLGVKGAGEAGCVGAMPAVANAVVDALSPLGIEHVEMPATPARLWKIIRDAKSS